MIYILIILGLICLDQLSKILAIKYIVNVGSIPIIKNIFHLTYVENRGAAFGMFQNNQMFFVLIALVACLVGIYYLYKKKLNLLGKISIMFIVSGAIGNLIDRVRLGYVVDYFDFRVFWSYVFNLADVFVVVGTILLCIYIIFFENDK